MILLLQLLLGHFILLLVSIVNVKTLANYPFSGHVFQGKEITASTEKLLERATISQGFTSVSGTAKESIKVALQGFLTILQ